MSNKNPFLSRSKMVNGHPQIRHLDPLWEDYMKRKQHRRSFEVTKTRRVTKQLQLVYTNIVGPVEVKSSWRSQVSHHLH